MDNLVQENGIHVAETTNSRILDFERFHITDRYWRNSPSVRTLMADVKGVTNRPMICSRDWEIHYPQLDKLYGNAQHTIHAVTEAIVAWCEAIIGLVTDESNWKWKNELIRNVDRRNGRIRLKIKIHQAESPSVVWSDKVLGFVLFIPEANVMDLSGLNLEFKKQLLSAFDSDELYHIPQAQYVKIPSELLLRHPYYLSIQASRACIIVKSSHSPSLFLAEYLRKNCRRSGKQISAMEHIFETKGPPVIDITLDQSPFTPKESAIYDTLTLKPAFLSGGRVNPISPLILVRLVENELGYEIDSSDQNSWYFIRREPLEEPLREPLRVVYQ
ncbi:hypothetical protein T069G_01830 [Trichoderma breve]|uniref:Uncharacterized protein n=1 Tax=Trichoderma breve TaxID=2034170 RepID=A0A9W9EEM7_9HYPO|nr:hypothetical protein T069G_01830 [Trichoderma breve]KAJ4865300.1 hypothetical protein T069G_01830 [Trichoderma breve]